MVYIFLAEGFEELEALAPIDILRRGGVDIKTVGVTDTAVAGAHGISIICDTTIDKIDESSVEAIILPGGMPGTSNLENNAILQRIIAYAAKNNLLIGAICAAPSILGHNGLLKGKKAVCFPGFENELYGADIKNSPCIKDGNIITACGAGVAFDFAFELLTAITNDNKKTEALKRAMLCK